jgi:hypothetical protein
LVGVEDGGEGSGGVEALGVHLAGDFGPGFAAGLVEGGEEDRGEEPAVDRFTGDAGGFRGIGAFPAGDQGFEGEALVVWEVEGLCGRGEGFLCHE